MRRNWWVTLGTIMALVGFVSAQEGGPSAKPPVIQTSGQTAPLPSYAPPTYYPPAQPLNTAPVYPGPIGPIETDPVDTVGALTNPWLFEAEYLLWWTRESSQVRDGFVGVAPVSDLMSVTDGRLQNITPLGGPSNSFDFGARSGLRLTLTRYFDDQQGDGIDISWMGFLKSTNSERYQSSDEFLLGPTFTDVGGTRSLVLASFPAFIDGAPTLSGRQASVNVESASRLWGAEANWKIRLPVAFFFDRVWLLAGTRMVQYGEGVSVETISRPLVGSRALSTVELRDSFTALNQFLGPQLGLQARTQVGRFSLDLVGKSSWGGQYEQIKVTGDTLIASPAGLQRLRGGVLTQATNIGSVDSMRMAWISELSVKGGWNFTDHIRATVGYNLLYSNRMVRVANAIDEVDSRSIQVLESFDPDAVATRPAPPQLTESYWWAQGITFGLDLSF